MHIATAPDVDELFAKELAPVIKLDRLFQSADTVSAESYLIQMLRERSVDSYLSLLPTELMRELRVRHTLVTSQLIACTEILRAPTLSVCAAAGGSGKGMDGPRKVHEGMNRDIVTLVHTPHSSSRAGTWCCSAWAKLCRTIISRPFNCGTRPRVGCCGGAPRLEN